ncbi:MAG: hypothetical protein R8L53_05465 [Mariprofundales bacterium]
MTIRMVWLAAFIIIMGAASPLLAASCCGGGSASALVMPKFAKALFSASLDMEKYDGFWRSNGVRVANPQGSNLAQQRINIGAAYRIAPRWQFYAVLPYVRNQNHYAALTSNTSGIGDAVLGTWYETFDDITCVWAVETWEDMKPAVYFGASLVVPTGISPHDDVANNFDITGRGFYRLDANFIIEKTIYPWNMSLQLNYGRHLSRPVNREFGSYIRPYDKRLGDRFSGSLSGGYTWFAKDMQSITGTLTYADLWEDQAIIAGRVDSTTGLRKRSFGFSLAWATSDVDWSVRLGWSHAIKRNGWGRNFPTTDIITLGVNHVIF